jgi:ATP-binding cassette subfamily B protein
LRQLRFLPPGVSLLRTAFQLILTTLAVIWLDPISAPLAIAGTVFFMGLSFLTQPILEEQDLRLRTRSAR